MKRVAEDTLIAWQRSPRRKPLIIRGARQVGKTWLVEKGLAPHFTNLVKVDLEKRRDLHFLFAGNLEPKIILQGLEVSLGRIVAGKTLLFFDEIQACPRAIMALRYFYEQMPELHVVAAGSLLEFAFADISVPVGRVEYLYLQPMTFFEYLGAVDKEPMAEQCRKSPAMVAEAVQQMILSELKTYFFVGGMPECVQVFRDSGSLLEVFKVQSDILTSYRDDFAKYSPRMDTTCLDAVLPNTARMVGEQLKYTRLNEGHSYQMNHKAFDLLAKARIIHKIPACNPSGLPLGASANPKKFKAAMLDIGLMQRLCQLPVDFEMKQDNLLAMYRGKLAEQFVAQEMLAQGREDLFYWARDARSSSAEIDYLAVREGTIYPVEVKSGAGGSLRSLHLFLEKYPNCPQGLVLHGGVYRHLAEQKLIFLPLYAAAGIGDTQMALC